MKKGLAIGQVFMYIVAVLTFALILIFGYRAIEGLLQTGEKAEFVQFKNGLEGDIQKIYTEYGAVRIGNFHPPARYESVCFVDMDKEGITETDIEALCEENLLACDAWRDVMEAKIDNPEADGFEMSEANVFLKPPGLDNIKVHKIRMTDGFLCIPIKSGNFKMRIEGKGSYAKLSMDS